MTKATIILSNPQPKKHSTRFDFQSIDHSVTIPVEPVSALETANDDLRSMSLYIPKPLAEGARKVRVTVEVIE